MTACGYRVDFSSNLNGRAAITHEASKLPCDGLPREHED